MVNFTWLHFPQNLPILQLLCKSCKMCNTLCRSCTCCICRSLCAKLKRFMNEHCTYISYMLCPKRECSGSIVRLFFTHCVITLQQLGICSGTAHACTRFRKDDVTWSDAQIVKNKTFTIHCDMYVIFDTDKCMSSYWTLMKCTHVYMFFFFFFNRKKKSSLFLI